MSDSVQTNRQIMSANIQRLMDENGKTRLDVCGDLGIKYSTLSEWIQGVKYPRIQNIELLAEYFGVSKSELVERYTPPKPQPPAPGLSPLECQMLAAFREFEPHLDENDIPDIQAFLSLLTARKRRFLLSRGPVES